MENYRPVSHLVQVGKIVEYAVYFQIVEHFVTNDLFHPNHHGSLANHSTATAITQLFDLMLEAADKQELSGVCLLDQSAAYDLMCHKGLKEKLEIYNFNGASVDWIMSYLGDRTQLVQIESRTSKPLYCDDHGVPQGSVLGGLLHVINSNDFPACHEVGESVVFVDDDSDHVQASDPAVLRNLIEQEAGNSAQWLKDNRLCVAGEKSKLMIIGTKKLRSLKVDNELKIKVDGKEIVETSSEKLLGVVINNELTWKTHLYGDKDNEGLIQQLSKRLGMLKRLARFMSKDKLKYFADSIFYSKLNYCLPVFGNVFGLDHYKEENTRYLSFTMKDNHNLQVLQNKLNRLLLNADYNTSTEDLSKESKTMSVHQMIAYQTAVAAYKIIKSNKPKYIASKMKSKEGSMNLRGRKGSVSQASLSLSIAREGFIYRGSSIINKLDEKLRNEEKLSKFKSGVRAWVLKNIQIKPTSRFPSIVNGMKRKPPEPDPPDPLPLNGIRRYLVPRVIPMTTNPPTHRLSTPTIQSSITTFFKPVVRAAPSSAPRRGSCGPWSPAPSRPTR